MMACLVRALGSVLVCSFVLLISGVFGLLPGGFVMDAYADGGTPVTSTQPNHSDIIADGASGIFDVQLDSDGNPVVFTNAVGATLSVPSTHGVKSAYGVKISGEGSSFINDGTIQHDGAGISSVSSASGVFTEVDNAIVENSGTISVTGDYGYGIKTRNSKNSSILNSGTITANNPKAGILYIQGTSNYTGLSFESSGTLALGSSGGSNYATKLVVNGGGYKSRFKNTGKITKVTSSTPTIDMTESSVLMLHGSNSITPLAITLKGGNSIYVEDINNPLPSGSSVTFNLGSNSAYASYYASDKTFNSTSISGSVPSYVSNAKNASVACDSGTEITIDADVDTIYGKTISELNVSELNGLLKINTAFSKPLRSYFPQYSGRVEIVGSGSLTSTYPHVFDDPGDSFELTIDTIASTHIAGDFEANTSSLSKRNGTLRFKQGYTNPVYSSKGLSYTETGGGEYRYFANLILDGTETYDLGTNSGSSSYAWEDITIESGASISAGTIGYADAKVTNNGTISGQLIFDSNAKDARFVSMLGSSVTGYVEGDTSVTQTVELNIDSDISMYDAESIFDETNGTYRNFSDIEILSDTPGLSFELSSSFPASVKKITVGYANPKFINNGNIPGQLIFNSDTKNVKFISMPGSSVTGYVKGDASAKQIVELNIGSSMLMYDAGSIFDGTNGKYRNFSEVEITSDTPGLSFELSSPFPADIKKITVGGDLEFIANMPSGDYIKSDIEVNTSSSKIGTLRFKQGYTSLVYSSTGLSHTDTGGHEFKGFANLALDGSQTYNLGSNAIYAWEDITIESEASVSDGTIGYADAKVTNNGTISGRLTFDSNATDARFISMPGSSVTGYVEGDNSVTQTVELNIDSDVSMYDAGSIFDGTNGKYRNFSEVEITSDTPGLSFELSSPFPADIKKITVGDDFELIASMPSDDYIKADVEPSTSSSKNGTLRLKQGYTTPVYSSTGLSHTDTGGHEFKGFANLALDGSQTYNLGSNAIYAWENITIESGASVSDGTIGYADAKVTNNGTISGQLTFDSNAKDARFVSMPDSSVTGYVEGDNSVTQTVELNIDSDVSMYDAESIFDETNGMYRNFSDVEITSDTPDISFELSSPFPASVKKITVGDDFELIASMPSDDYIKADVEPSTSSSKNGTLRLKQGYTTPVYSSTGLSHTDTGGHEFKGFANLALDGGQTYNLGSNAIYAWENITIESGASVSDGTIGYADAKVTNNGTISGQLIFDSNAKDARFVSMLGSSVTGYVEGDNSVTQTVELNIDSDVSMYDAESIFDETNGMYRNFSDVEITSDTPDISFELSSPFPASVKKITVGDDIDFTTASGAYMTVDDSSQAITVNGTINGDILFGSDDDYLVFGHAGSLSGTINGGAGSNEILLEGINSSSPAKDALYFQSNFTDFSKLQVNGGSEFSIDTKSDFFDDISIDSTSLITHNMNHTSSTIGATGDLTNLVNNGSYDITTLSAPNAVSPLIYGNYTQGSSGTLYVEVDASGSTLNLSGSKILAVDEGDVVLDGKINIAHVGGMINPDSIGSSVALVNVLDPTKSLSGEFTGYDMDSTLRQDYEYDFSYTSSGVIATLKEATQLPDPDSGFEYLDPNKFRKPLDESGGSADDVLGSDDPVLEGIFRPILDQPPGEQEKSIKEALGNGYVEEEAAHNRSAGINQVKSYRDFVSTPIF